MQIVKTTISSFSHNVYTSKYRYKNRYSFLYILTKFHTKIVKKIKDTAKSLGTGHKVQGGGLEKIGGGPPIFEFRKGGGSWKIEHQYGGGSS